MNARASLAVAPLLVLLACSSEERRTTPPRTDAGTGTDAGAIADSGSTADSNVPDDAAATDAAEPDVGAHDAGRIDPPQIIVFTASPSSVSSGSSALLLWNTSGADSISISANPGGAVVDNSTMAMGSIQSAALTATTIFTLTAVNGGGMVSTDTTVSVDPGNPVIARFDANPISVNAGDTTTLSWDTMNGMRVRILQGATTLFDTMTMVDSGSFVTGPLPQGSNPFTLEVSNFAHQRTALVVVNAN